MSAKTAEWLKKGALVQLFGRIGLSVYTSSDGRALGSLTFHINNLKILVFAKKAETAQNTASPKAQQNTSQDPDDLPF